MQLHVLRELRQPIGSVSAYDIEERRLRTDDVELSGLEGSITLLRTDRGLLVTVRARAAMPETCSRCVVEVECPVEIKFEEEYIPVINADTGARVRMRKDSDVFRIGPDFVLDLREGLRQYVLMSEPAKPLCRPDCKGLCPKCGANLNNGPCGCGEETDARWGALAGLRVNDREGS